MPYKIRSTWGDVSFPMRPTLGRRGYTGLRAEIPVIASLDALMRAHSIIIPSPRARSDVDEPMQ